VESEAPQQVPAGGSGNRNKLLALVGAATLLVLGVVAYFLLFAGGGEEPAPAPVRPSGAQAVPEVEAPAQTPVKSRRITSKNFGRDPFKALIVEPETVAPATAVVTTGQTTTTPTTVDPATSGSTQGSTTGTTTTTTTPDQTTAHRFKVVNVAPDNTRISVKVDGTFYNNLKAGEVFATYFKVRFIGGTVNDFQFGEESFKVVGTKAVSIG
jgi:hypothetical protein